MKRANVEQFKKMGKASFTARLASAVTLDKQLAKARRAESGMSRN